jgi:hypothetical protein
MRNIADDETQAAGPASARFCWDLNLISSPTVAAAYGTHWRQRLAVSAPYAQPVAQRTSAEKSAS